MCLASISQKLDPSPLIESGWKEFTGPQDKPNFQAQTFRNAVLVPLDKWITAEGTIIKGPPDYPAGFHIYSNELDIVKDTRRFRRVYFRNAHTRGTQDAKTVTVAREMYVPSDPEAWPPKG